MNFAFFEQLSPEDAERYKARFLEVGKETVADLARDASERGITADFSVDSVPPVVEWLVSLASTVPLAPDPALPEWIRSSDSYERNLFDFDERSKVLVLRGAYYLGESFVRGHTSLRWAVGQSDTAPQGQPVVSGFTHHMELPVLLVAENLFARAVADESALADIARAVASWEANIPR